MKKIAFKSGSLRELKAFPDAARREAGYQLHRVQEGLEPTDWKPMASIGAGAREIRIRSKGAFRVIYVAKYGDTVYVLRAFQKKTQKTPKHDIEMARMALSSLINQLSG